MIQTSVQHEDSAARGQLRRDFSALLRADALSIGRQCLLQFLCMACFARAKLTLIRLTLIPLFPVLLLSTIWVLLVTQHCQGWRPSAKFAPRMHVPARCAKRLWLLSCVRRTPANLNRSFNLNLTGYANLDSLFDFGQHRQFQK